MSNEFNPQVGDLVKVNDQDVAHHDFRVGTVGKVVDIETRYFGEGVVRVLGISSGKYTHAAAGKSLYQDVAVTGLEPLKVWKVAQA